MGQPGVAKQYLPLAEKTVLEWALSPILSRADCAGVVVALAADDQEWARLAVAKDPRVRAVIGGTERAQSVQAALKALQAESSDWVLVHDAARPCLGVNELDALIQDLREDAVGGLLATPMVDTLKRADGDGRVAATVSRDSLWRALTPQMFRYEILCRALEAAGKDGRIVTDEAQAIELLGMRPRLVAGSIDNIKVTLPDDLRRAERILSEMMDRQP